MAAIQDWTNKGYVEASRAWVSCNPLFVEKKNGAIRTCIDYRPINSVTPGWDWPFPKIKDMRHRLRTARWYTRMDLKDAFHRIKIPAAYRPLTAFHSPWGTYQFTRMPFGLSTAPATYQRFLDWVLHPVREWVINYVDDILVWGKSLGELRAKTRRIRQLLRDHDIEVNEDKSEYNQPEVDFVGLRLRRGAVGTALPMTAAPVPRTVSDWQSLLGYANCFRDYLPLSELTAGLYPGSNQLPEPDRQRKLDVLWDQLSRAVSLSHYEDNQPATLYLDASKYAIGAVLTQKGKVNAVFSKGLSRAQQNYSATDREHLALMHGLEAFRVFLHSNAQITTFTDHSG